MKKSIKFKHFSIILIFFDFIFTSFSIRTDTLWHIAATVTYRRYVSFWPSAATRAAIAILNHGYWAWFSSWLVFMLLVLSCFLRKLMIFMGTNFLYVWIFNVLMWSLVYLTCGASESYDLWGFYHLCLTIILSSCFDHNTKIWIFYPKLYP